MTNETIHSEGAETVRMRTRLPMTYLIAVLVLARVLWEMSSPGGFARSQGKPGDFLALSSVPSTSTLEKVKLDPDALLAMPPLVDAFSAAMQSPHPQAAEAPQTATVSSLCGTAAGTLFNLEPPSNALPQYEPPVDFLYNRIPRRFGGNTDLIVQHANDWRGLGYAPGSESTSLFVHRSDATNCSPDLEMGNPLISGMHAVWDPQVVADSNNDQFLFTDIRYSSDGQTTGLGLRRIPAVNLLNTAVCPNGTLTQSQAQTCAGSTAVVVDQSTSNTSDWTGLAQDPRVVGAGPGAGDIYVVTTVENRQTGDEYIHLTACKALFLSLTHCSSPIAISTLSESSPASPRVSVVPGGPNWGTMTITYITGAAPSSAPQCNGGTRAEATCRDLKIVVCTPSGAPSAPSCGAPKLIVTEPNAVFHLSGNQYAIPTLVAHTNRPDGSTGQTTFAVWTRCKTDVYAFAYSGLNCPDADVVMAASTDLGNTWTLGTVDTTNFFHQFHPDVEVDASTGITNIAYHSMVNSFNNYDVLMLRQIPPGTTMVGPAIRVTSVGSSASSDPHLAIATGSTGGIYGEYIGISAKGTGAPGGSHLYVGHAKDMRYGTYGQPPVNAPELNNHVSRVDY